MLWNLSEGFVNNLNITEGDIISPMPCNSIPVISFCMAPYLFDSVKVGAVRSVHDELDALL